MNARANTTINASQATHSFCQDDKHVQGDATRAINPRKISAGDDLNDLLSKGNCRLEGLRGMIHALIIGLDGGGDLSANPEVVTRALYGVLYQIEEAEKLFTSAEEVASYRVPIGT
ncbi:hypothetical protein [Dyella caseinilytica]|uniref:Uncharacterized protein n=1 Tax=Dyella caseinilytica TaxID=1849581 RepID=A0ABX7GZE2_9GAMM|nr:hypothetical protein [Dyella caseinilytica]QRN55393.1 hypothetical protein ISN74_08755 [Dyella caseinilytica]